MTPSDDLVRMTKEQVEMWRTFATHMEHWMPSTPNPESCPVVLIEPDQLERLCDLALAQLAARAEPQPVAWEPSFQWQEDAISILQRVQITDWSVDPATGHPRHVAECTAADLLDCVLKELPPLYAAPPACALGGEPDMRELWKALQDLSFDCFAGIGARQPSIDVYNRTFAVCQRMQVKYPTIDLPKGVKIECELPDRYALGFQEAREAAKAKAEGRLAYYRGMMQIDEEGAALEIIEDISALEPKA